MKREGGRRREGQRRKSSIFSGRGRRGMTAEWRNEREREIRPRPPTHKSAAKREEREESIKPIRIGIAMAD